MIKVFVYGSLKHDFYNHVFLDNSAFVGVHVTDPIYTMYDLGAFPAVCLDGETAITGEVYEVDEATFIRLDRLEGYPHFYNRMLIPTPYGDAYMYYLTDYEDAHRKSVETGVWLQ